MYGAALDPQALPTLLQSLTKALDAAGAAYIVRNSRSGIVEQAAFSGPSTEFRSDYVTHFSSRDPFTGLLTSGGRKWMRLSESLPMPFLSRDEWYNDFVLRCGVGDMLGAQIAGTGSHTAIFGIHEAVGQKPLGHTQARRLDRALASLSKAVDVQLKLQELGWRSAIAVRALDQLSTGVIVAHGDGRVIEMNGLAEHVIRRGDGLTVENDRLAALRVFESARLAECIAAATGNRGGTATSSRIVVGRNGSLRSYILTVTPLDVQFGFHDDPVALILVIDPDERSPKASDLAQYFGLSPAEGKLAVHLMSGKTMAGVSAASGVAISTLRTQLRSILKKVGAERQADLLRVLASAPSSLIQSSKSA